MNFFLAFCFYVVEYGNKIHFKLFNNLVHFPAGKTCIMIEPKAGGTLISIVYMII